MKLVSKFQAGGVAPAPVPAEQAAPQGGDPMEQLILAAQEALNTQNPELAMQVCAALLELVGAVPTEMGAPQNAGSQPVFKNGGRIVRYTSPLDKYRRVK